MMELPRRIVDGGAGDWERSVILSARLDAPSEQFRRDLRRKIGVAASAAGVTTATANAKALGGVLLKWVTLGFTIGVVGVGTASYVAYPVEHSASPRQDATRPQGVRPPSALRERLANDSRPSEHSSVATLVDAPATSGVSTSHLNMSPPPATDATVTRPTGVINREYPPGQTQLSEQIAAVKGARAALASHDASRALSDIDHYERTYPAGLFNVEIQVLRVDALFELGRYAAARELGQQFLAVAPDSPYAQHVRSVTSAAARTN
jgi:hypothetical protein